MKLLNPFLNFFKSPTIGEIITNDIVAERKIIDQCNQQITNALFQKALSSAKLKAMQDWAAAASSIPTSTNTKG